MTLAIEAAGLVKRFGKTLAVDGAAADPPDLQADSLMISSVTRCAAFSG